MHLYFMVLWCLILSVIENQFIDASRTENIAEIAIVCDKEFSSNFEFSRPKIINYWKAFFYDLNLRFKTLKSISISFRVTSITIIQDVKDQPFIEDSRTERGQVDARGAFIRFSEWIYDKKESLDFPGFDFAIAATGAYYSDPFDTFAFVGDPCTILHQPARHMVLGSFVVSMTGFSSVASAAYKIAHMLGVINEYSPEPVPEMYQNFVTGCTLNSTSGFIVESSVRAMSAYSFSECTDKAIGAFIQTQEANCLRKTSSSKAIIDTSKLGNGIGDISSPVLSLEEQCRVVSGNRAAFVKQAESNCALALCRYTTNHDGNEVDTIQKFNPFDGASCQNNGRCFRGSCQNKTEVFHKAEL